MRRSRGFTLIELLIVLVIISLLVAMAAMVTRAITSQQRRSLTATRLAGIDAALAQFVILQKRLPCPADGSLASANANAGDETARDVALGCTAEQKGVVPWKAIGLAEADVTDGWERRMTYRVQPILAANNAMDMSSCDPAGTALAPVGGPCNAPGPGAGCNSTAPNQCTPPALFLNGKGLPVQTVAGTVVMTPPNTAAAYVVISHGESGGGGYLNSGQLYASTTTDGDEEKKNYADQGMQPYYLDDALNETPGATHFDDVVSRPTVIGVANKAGLGPRTH
jgi:prepilin-type N-terminal cleavage/methylation domain-containing protein